MVRDGALNVLEPRFYLPPRHRRVLELYYGEELTLRQIGNVLGVTEARISQLVSGAVKKLRTSVSIE